MQRHTDQLYRLAELPAFIEEALGNASLKDLIHAHLWGTDYNLGTAMDDLVNGYAEQWVDDWMARHPEPVYEARSFDDEPELRAIEAGVKLFSNPDCKAGLPE